MDGVLERPHPYFHACKAAYHHAFHGRSRAGDVVFIERAGRVRHLARVLGELGAPPLTAALHVAFVLEYMSQALDARPLPGGRALRIVDVAGISLPALAAAETRQLLRTCAGLLSPFFPERVSHMLIVNAPPGFGLLWGLVSGLLSKRTSARITVVEAGNAAALRAVLAPLVDDSQLPVAYGGTCRCAGPGGCWRQHPMERELWERVERCTPPDQRLGVQPLVDADFS
jgi:hypothetical protein